MAAIHLENFRTTLAPRADLLSGKVLIDVSNRTNRYSAVSNAEFLQSLVPDALVVKAFNSVSAYSMEDQATVSSSRVFVGSDDQAARERVMDLARDLGFAPCDMGGLRAARSMEAFVLKVFPGWKVPLFLTLGVFNLWALYCVYIYFIDRTAYRWDQVSRVESRRVGSSRSVALVAASSGLAHFCCGKVDHRVHRGGSREVSVSAGGAPIDETFFCLIG